MTNIKNIKNNIAVALDNFNREEALDFVRATKHDLGFYKIGLELYLRYGRELVQEISKEDVNLFLDLKLHDIPNTVFKSIQSLQGLNIQYLTLHLGGGPSMLSKAHEARELYLPKTKLLGVSFLTSMDQKELMSVFNFKNPADIALGFQNYFQMALLKNIDGVVHSGEELELAEYYPFTSVCPGIRFQDEIDNQQTQDQKRVMTPEMALKNLTPNKNIILVIGRSLTTNHQSEIYHKRVDHLKTLFAQKL